LLSRKQKTWEWFYFYFMETIILMIVGNHLIKVESFFLKANQKNMGKGQNVENHFVESQRKNIESQKKTSKIRTSKVSIKVEDFRRSDQF
jgi:hypothetical protein